jgi:putative sigma-54 modulation protein
MQSTGIPSSDSKIIVSGIHMLLTDALKSAVHDKVARLLHHEVHILRVRVDLEFDTTKSPEQRFIAKGHVEIGGPDLIAHATSDDCYKSIDLLVDKLDALLRKRSDHRKEKRNHPHPVEIPSELPKV